MFYTLKQGNNLPHDPFKAIVSPRPIGWISSIDKEQNVNLAPYSYFNALADEPPMVMFSTNGKKSDRKNRKDSLSNIIETKEFVVNMVSKALLMNMNATSGNYPKNVDEFEICNLQKAKCNLVSAPRISNSPASLECKLFQVLKLPGKNNNMIIGEVIGIHISDDFLKDGVFDILDFKPIARLGYMDYTTISEKFSLERPD